MKKNLLTSLILYLLVAAALAQQGEKAVQGDTTSTDGKVSGKLFFGLYKWGEAPDSISSFSFQFETSSQKEEELFLKENDSLELKSIFWGAIKWTEKKEKNKNQVQKSKDN